VRVVSTVAEVRAARGGYPSLGFVPTMGALHEGHLSLVRAAKGRMGAVACSIFVNPTQFAPTEDLTRYPRPLERDLALLAAEGCDLVFTPTPDIVYPPGFSTRIEVDGVTAPLEGAVRPGHFSGVATVVTKLFNIVQPDAAWFGQKDAQQCAVIRRMAADLDMPVEIVVAPTVREPDVQPQRLPEPRGPRRRRRGQPGAEGRREGLRDGRAGCGRAAGGDERGAGGRASGDAGLCVGGRSGHAGGTADGR
jgi:pantoate--beta-alanine ligase